MRPRCGPEVLLSGSRGGTALAEKLTDRLLRNTKAPQTGRITISDTERAGLRFRVTANGARSFLFEKKVKGGRRIATTIGSYPECTLANARAQALILATEAQAGVDRAKVAEQERAAQELEAAQAKTVNDVLERYIGQHVRVNLKSGQSREERERQLRTYLAPFSDIRIGDLTRANIQGIVDNKAAEGRRVMANRLRSAICAFTHWAFQRDYIAADPGVKVQKAGNEKPRDRTPSVAEIREIWVATKQMGPLWGPLIRLLILTGQRREEIARAEWAWVDQDRAQMEIPDPKNGRAHTVHLAPPVLAELDCIRDYQASAGHKSTAYLFTTNGSAPTSGVSKAVERLRKKINAMRQAQGKDAMPHWTLHDFRRAQATALAGNGFPESVVDRIQNHVASGSRPSQVAAVYQKHALLEERARALDVWAGIVAGTDDDASNVVELARAQESFR